MNATATRPARIATAQIAKNLRVGAKVADRLGRVGFVVGGLTLKTVEVEFEFGTYPMYRTQLRHAA